MPVTYDKIATTTLASATTTITFSSISSSYTDLVLVGKILVASGGAQSFLMKFNGDSSDLYSLTRLYYNGVGAAGADATNTSTQGFAGIVDSSGTITNGSTIEFQIYDYANTTTFQTSFCRTDNGTSGIYQSFYGHTWRSTAAVNSISIITSNNMVVGSNLTLYGIAAA